MRPSTFNAHGYVLKNHILPRLGKAEALSEAEVEDDLGTAAELGYLPIFLLALEHGLRQRERIALKWSDLDIDSRALTIHMERVVERRELVNYGAKPERLP